MNTGDKPLRSRSGLLSTVAWQLGESGRPVYALEGGAFVCGAAVQWLRDGLRIIKRAPDIEALARSVEDHGGVEFVPALTGLGAPHWAPDARGTLTGLTRGTEQGHIARATLDAMALQNADILRAMQKDLGKRMKPLRVDGGAAANDLLMQIQADLLGAYALGMHNLLCLTGDHQQFGKDIHIEQIAGEHHAVHPGEHHQHQGVVPVLDPVLEHLHHAQARRILAEHDGAETAIKFAAGAGHEN